VELQEYLGKRLKDNEIFDKKFRNNGCCF